MCCHFDRVPGVFVPKSIGFEQDEQQKICHIKGVVDRTLKLSDRILRIFQRIELIEKISEIVDESFHLLGWFFQQYTNPTIYQTLQSLHHSAHNIEHVLHPLCFLGDISRFIMGDCLNLTTNKFFEYQDSKCTQIDFLLSTAHICHAISHLFAAIPFFSRRYLFVEKYSILLSAGGFALGTISLIWNRHQKKINDHFITDLFIHGGGFLFVALPFTKSISFINRFSEIVNKIAALAGICHAVCFTQRLLPNNFEEVYGHFIMPSNEEIENRLDHLNHIHFQAI